MQMRVCQLDLAERDVDLEVCEILRVKPGGAERPQVNPRGQIDVEVRAFLLFPVAPL
jgi:hypothetical protein